LGRDEAVARLKQEIERHRAIAGNLREEWLDHTLSFGFEFMGMKAAGTVAVEDSQVVIESDLPLAAMMFKPQIEARLRLELARVLG
jgi:hypothetical protein